MGFKAAAPSVRPPTPPAVLAQSSRVRDGVPRERSRPKVPEQNAAGALPDAESSNPAHLPRNPQTAPRRYLCCAPLCRPCEHAPYPLRPAEQAAAALLASGRFRWPLRSSETRAGPERPPAGSHTMRRRPAIGPPQLIVLPPHAGWPRDLPGSIPATDKRFRPPKQFRGERHKNPAKTDTSEAMLLIFWPELHRTPRVLPRPLDPPAPVPRSLS